MCHSTGDGDGMVRMFTNKSRNSPSRHNHMMLRHCCCLRSGWKIMSRHSLFQSDGLYICINSHLSNWLVYEEAHRQPTDNVWYVEMFLHEWRMISSCVWHFITKAFHSFWHTRLFQLCSTFFLPHCIIPVKNSGLVLLLNQVISLDSLC